MPLESLPNLPEAVDIEKVVLGVLLSAPDAASAILGLEDHDFYLNQHRQIVAAARWCYENGHEITAWTVHQRLKENGHAESVGGLEYLHGLDVPHIYGLESYIGTLRLKSTMRRVAIAAHELSERVCLPGAELGDIRATEQLLQQLSSDAERGAPTLLTLGEYIAKAGGLKSFLRPDRKNSIPTPWTHLNSMLTGGGFQPGQMVVLGARPSLGKSATAALIALHARKKGVALFSLEMGSLENWHRIIASYGNLPLKAVSEEDLDANPELGRTLLRLTSELADETLYLDDTTGANISAVIAAVRRRPGVRLVVLDYLQLLRPIKNRNVNRTEEVSELSRSIKLAARELKIPILVLSQLSRASATAGRPPQLQDLRESGAIEQDADTVIFLHAEKKEVDAAIKEKRPSLLDLIIAKQRNGRTGTVHMKFNPANMQIFEIEQE